MTLLLFRFLHPKYLTVVLHKVPILHSRSLHPIELLLTHLSKYLEKGNPIPEKGNILSIIGRKGDDILFIDDMNILDHKIYMKLSELK